MPSTKESSYPRRPTSWNDLWVALDAYYALIAGWIAEAHPGVRTVPYHHANDRYPFIASLTVIIPDVPDGEDLFLLVDVHRESDGDLKWSTSVSTETGLILAELPDFYLADSGGSLADWISIMHMRAEEFFDGEKNLIARYLNGERDD